MFCESLQRRFQLFLLESRKLLQMLANKQWHRQRRNHHLLAMAFHRRHQHLLVAACLPQAKLHLSLQEAANAYLVLVPIQKVIFLFKPTSFIAINKLWLMIYLMIIAAKGIYIGGLPYDITKEGIVDVVKQFGQVNTSSDTVQIRRHEVRFKIFSHHLCPIQKISMTRFCIFSGWLLLRIRGI